MIVKHLISSLMCAVILIGVSCSSPYSSLLKKSTFATVELRDRCVQYRLTSSAKQKADSLFTTAKKLSGKRKEKERYYLMNLSAAYYTIALTQRETIKVRIKVDTLEQRLIKAGEELKNYKEVLDKIATMKE